MTATNRGSMCARVNAQAHSERIRPDFVLSHAWSTASDANLLNPNRCNHLGTSISMVGWPTRAWEGSFPLQEDATGGAVARAPLSLVIAPEGEAALDTTSN